MAAAFTAGAAAAGAIALLLRSKRRANHPMNPPSFVLERFFAQYEFSAKYQVRCVRRLRALHFALLPCRVRSLAITYLQLAVLSLRELLIMCAGDKEMLTAWGELSLGYREPQPAGAARRDRRVLLRPHLRGGCS